MDDELQNNVKKTINANTLDEPIVASPGPKKSKRILWVVFGISFVFICLCSISCLILIISSVGKVMVEKAPIMAVLDSFMKDMVDKNVESAYELFSPRSKAKLSKSDLGKMLIGNNYVLFDGYERVTVENMNISANVSTNPNAPQGIVANITGTIFYTGEFTGQLQAVMEKVEGSWKIYGINIIVPPDKFSNGGNNSNIIDHHLALVSVFGK